MRGEDQGEDEARRRSAERTGRGFLRRLRTRRQSKCASEDALRALEPPQSGSAVQGVRARAACGMFARQTTWRDAADHQRALVIAVIDYKAGNLTSVMK